jgi:dipeptidyl aminopeptidase/acylaminoacyl peptidase
MQMYQALKLKGVPTQLVLYPRAEHGVSERAHRLDLLQRQLDWFDTYLK